MGEPDFDRLTAGQRECLRLVHRRYQNKLIARELGIAVPTVKQRLAAARVILRVGTSVEAARLLAERERALYPSGIYPPEPLPRSGADGAAKQPEVEAEPNGSSLRDPRVSYAFAGQAKPFPLPIPQPGRDENDLSWWQIALWGSAIAILIPLLMAALLNLYDALARQLS